MADPWAINASAGSPSYTASELRRLDAPLTQPQSSNRFGAVQGVRPGGGVIVSLAGSTITVAAHSGVISPDLTTTQGAYRYQLPTNETHALTAAHLTLARTDLVVMRVDDHDEDASGARQALSAYVVGTAGAGVPSLPARSFEIARVAVPASGGGSPSLTERARYTVAAGGILPVRDTADRPNHYEGRAIYQMDTDSLLLSNGATWLAPANLPWGPVVAPVKVTANNSITTEEDFATLAAATLVSGRRYKLSFSIKGFVGSDASAMNMVIRFKEGGTQYAEFNRIVEGATANEGGSYFLTLDCTADISAGSHTFKVTLQRATGAFVIDALAAATTPATLLLEDIGGT